MTSENQLTLFNYADFGDLKAADTKALEGNATRIEKVQERVRKAGAEGVMAIGKELTAAQDRLANHGDGTFGKWAQARCGFTRQSAYRAIAAFGTFKDCNIMLQTFDPTALYLLSADSCPEGATAEALKLAETGEKITAKRAKEIIAEVGGDDGDDESDAEFDIDLAGDRATDDIRKTFSSWPQDARCEIESILSMLLEEDFLSW